MMTRIAISVLLTVVLMFAAYADVPETVNFQGQLTDPTGNPLTGSYNLLFSIYNSPTGGILLWSETQSVTAADGLFSVELGSITTIPDSALTGSAAYLQIQVDSDPPLSPRTLLVSVPYSRVSSSLIGSGPLHFEAVDVSSGDISNILHGVGINAGGNESDCYKDVSVTLLSTDKSSSSELVSLDSGVVQTTTAETATGRATGRRVWRPYAIIDSTEVTDGAAAARTKSTSTLNDIEIEKEVDNSMGTTTSHWLNLNADTGLVEITTSSNASGLATGKRRHRPFTITKELDASNLTSTVSHQETLHVDTGFSETAAMNKADLINRISKGVSQTREHILLARQSGMSGATAEKNVYIESDDTAASVTVDWIGLTGGLGSPPSGDMNRVTMESNDTAAAVVIITGLSTLGSSLSGMESANGRSTIRAHDFGVSGDTAKIDMIVDSDTGPDLDLTYKSSMDSSNVRLRSKNDFADILVRANTGLVEMSVDDITSGLEIQAEYVPYLGDVILEIPAESGPRLDLRYQSASDSSSVEMLASDTSDHLIFSQITGGTKYSNITLKRGITGSSISVSHVGAGTDDGVFVSSNAAAGGALGINTSSPVLPFQLVGSGCYTGTFGACSDKRYKNNITTLNSPIATLRKLRGVTYEWNQSDFPDHKFPDGKQVGVIAQEVEQILPSIVSTDKEGYKSVDYAKLTPVLIEAVKAQQIQLENQQTQIKSQQTQINELKDLVQQLLAGQNQSKAEYSQK